MTGTEHDLQKMAHYISCYGLETGDQMARQGDYNTYDIPALAFRITEHHAPAVFFTNPDASVQLIKSSERAMACIRAISAAITDYEVPDTDGQPDVIEHVLTWVSTPPIGATEPPSICQVIGCILRAANHALNRTV